MSLADLNDKLEGGDLAPGEIDAAFAEIMDGQALHEEIKRFLTLTIRYMSDAKWRAAACRWPSTATAR
jgi:hypothetical protein